MIIWQGWGWLVALFGVGFAVTMEKMVNSLFHDPLYFSAHGWPKLLALEIAAVLTFIVGKHLSHKPGRRMIDKATGQEIELKPRHTLFFIPMPYWGFILAGIGVILFFV